MSFPSPSQPAGISPAPPSSNTSSSVSLPPLSSYSLPTISTYEAQTKNITQHRSAESLLDPNSYYIFGYGSLVWKPNFPYVERRLACLPNYVRRCWQSSPDHRGTPEYPGFVVTVLPSGHPDLLLGSEYGIDGRSHAHQELIDKVQNPRLAALLQQNDCCWGVVYRIAREDVAEVVAYLDHREQKGYDCVVTDVHTLKIDPEFAKQFPSRSFELNAEAMVALDDDEEQTRLNIEFDPVPLNIGHPGEHEVVKAVCWFATTDNPYYKQSHDQDIASTIARAQGESGPNPEYMFKLESFVQQTGLIDLHLQKICELTRKEFTSSSFQKFPYSKGTTTLHSEWSCARSSHSSRSGSHSGMLSPQQLAKHPNSFLSQAKPLHQRSGMSSPNSQSDEGDDMGKSDFRLAQDCTVASDDDDPIVTPISPPVTCTKPSYTPSQRCTGTSSRCPSTSTNSSSTTPRQRHPIANVSASPL